MPELDDEVGAAALVIWNQMDGEIEWAALPFLAQLHGVDDMELLTLWLTRIRAGMRAQQGAPRG